MSTLLTKSIESSIKTVISEATVGLHKKIETQGKEIQISWQEPSWWILPII
jgi:hypothetical protein